MVGLFEQWETEQQQQQKIQKNAFQKSYKLICILMSEKVFDPLSISKISGSQVSFIHVRSWD